MTEEMTHKPLIGILPNFHTVEEGLFAGVERIFVSRDYVNALLRAGGIPLLLPIISDIEVIYRQIEAVDAVLISGGQDIHPHHYQEEPSHWIDSICVERDHFEIHAIKYAHSLGKPIFGICRGLQLINVAFGGTLYQDIPHHFPSQHLQHIQKAKKHEPSHTVDIILKTKLHTCVGKESLITNSFHHQAVKDLAPGFCVNASAKDGVIEGIEKSDSSFVLGVQWHPEMMAEHHLDMQKLFSFFVEQARNK